MRELKFRAWWPDVKELVYFGNPEIICDTENKWGIFFEAKYNVFLGQCDVEQFTGLHDKNGKEIYEGDILQSDGGLVGKVVFDDGTFSCRSKKLLFWSASSFEDDLIIGNIHENPELLK
jgi:uncharacterized phage protein (TIGR01671 family)